MKNISSISMIWHSLGHILVSFNLETLDVKDISYTSVLLLDFAVLLGLLLLWFVVIIHY